MEEHDNVLEIKCQKVCVVWNNDMEFGLKKHDMK